MKTYPRLQKPFMLWMVRQFLPVDRNEERIKPISNKEFYGTMVMISLTLLVLVIMFIAVAD